MTRTAIVVGLVAAGLGLAVALGAVVMILVVGWG